MKKIIEIVKENKGVIIKKTLLIAGLAAAAVAVGGLIAKRNADDEDYVFEDEGNYEVEPISLVE
jgi:hypothetical protein